MQQYDTKSNPVVKLKGYLIAIKKKEIKPFVKVLTRN